RFTRDGSFHLQPVGNNDELELVTKDGHYVAGNDGEPIQFAADNVEDINIADDGTVTVERDGQNEEVGQIAVVSIENPRILEDDGDNEYRLPDPDESGIDYQDVVQDVSLDADLMQNK